MYYGKMTKELEYLYSEYEKKFGHNVDGILDLEYSDCDYHDYVKDIKKAINTFTPIYDLYPDYDDEF